MVLLFHTQFSPLHCMWKIFFTSQSMAKVTWVAMCAHQLHKLLNIRIIMTRLCVIPKPLISAQFLFQFENQRCLFGRWTTISLGTKPPFSDIWGKVSLRREDLIPPPGWSWGGDWTITLGQTSPAVSVQEFEEVIDDIFENQSRQPLSHWPNEKSSFWTDEVSE